MKMRNTGMCVYLGVLLLLSGSACNCPTVKPNDRQTPHAEPKVAAFPTNDAIAYAVRFAAVLPDDEDGVQTQSKILEEVAQACLQRKERERAEAVAEKIKRWQRGTAFADLARAYALAGKTNEANRLLLRAEGWRALTREQTRESSMGWTAGRIRDHIAAARAALGEMAESSERLGKPMLDVNPRVVSQWIAGDTHRTNADFLQTLSVVFTNTDSAVQQGLELGVMAWADKQEALSPQAAEEIIAVVKASLKLQPETDQLPVQAELVRFLRRHGRSDAAEAMIRELETTVRAMKTKYYLSAGLADAALLCWQTDTNRAFQLVREAEAEAHQNQDSSRSAALSHVAECAVKLGDTNLAQRVYRDALDAAIVPPGATLRLKMLVETCASLGGAGVPLTPELQGRLNELAAKEEEAAKATPKLPDWARGVPEKN